MNTTVFQTALRLTKRALAPIILACFLGGMAPASAQGKEICNKSMLPLYLAYAYVDTRSGNWEKVGWYETGPGECHELRTSQNGKYYYYADGKDSDMVVKALDKENSFWGGSEGRNDTAMLCVTTAAFHDDANSACSRDSRREPFEAWVPGIYDRKLLTSTDSERKLGLAINTLADAKAVYRAVKGQLMYGRSLGSDPKGTPFRLGIEIEADEHGVIVTNVSAGMPADGLLEVGDRLEMINGKHIETVYDAIFEVQEFGYDSDPRNRNLQVGVYRWSSLEEPPAALTGTLDLAYYRELDSEISQDGQARASGRALFQGATFGLGSVLVCAGQAFADGWNGKPAHQRDTDCIAEKHEDRARAYEMYPDETGFFDLVGSAFSPRLVLRLMSRQAAKNTLRRIAVGALDEAAQAGIQELAWAEDLESVSPPDIVKSMLVGAAIGGTVSAVTGQ